MGNQHDPLYELDARDRLAELQEAWVDEFVRMCEQPPQTAADLPAHLAFLREQLARLAEIEAEEAQVKGELP